MAMTCEASAGKACWLVATQSRRRVLAGLKPLLTLVAARVAYGWLFLLETGGDAMRRTRMAKLTRIEDLMEAEARLRHAGEYDKALQVPRPGTQDRPIFLPSVE